MRLLSYKLINKSTAMDVVYNMMFRRQIPNVNGKGTITVDKIEDMNQKKLLMILGNLTKEHRNVAWELLVRSKGRHYKFSAIDGIAKRENVTINQECSCKRTT